jgi:hypothetical protein
MKNYIQHLIIGWSIAWGSALVAILVGVGSYPRQSTSWMMKQFGPQDIWVRFPVYVLSDHVLPELC